MAMGRPKKNIDLEQLADLMHHNPSLADTAAFFKCNIKTIERHIARNYKLTFVQFRHQNMVHTRLKLIKVALKKALAGDNCMLIFCLKNLCGWQDKPVESFEPVDKETLEGFQVIEPVNGPDKV